MKALLTMEMPRLRIDVFLQGLQLPKLFDRMEGLKESAGVEEYSISQTTLEHVFVQLARQ